MTHTHRLPMTERLQRIEDQLRMLAWFAGGRHESVPSPSVWSGMQDLLTDLATELREVHDGLSAQIADAPVSVAPRAASGAEPQWPTTSGTAILRSRPSRTSRPSAAALDGSGVEPAE